MVIRPQAHSVRCEGACPTVPSPLVGEGQGEGWRRNSEREACLVHRLTNNMKQRSCLFYPSPCPSPARGEGTVGHAPSHLTPCACGRISKEMCACPAPEKGR